MTEGYWAIVTWESGEIGEKLKYWTSGKAPTRSERQRKQDLRKQKANANNAIRHLNRLMNVNFPASHGVTIALTYEDNVLDKLIGQEYRVTDPEQWDSAYAVANHQLELWLRRCRRQCAKAGIEFRYIALTSDLGWSGRDQDYIHVRLHHHVVVSPECRDICVNAWKLGQAFDKRLEGEVDHYAYAEYLLKQTRQVEKGAARYIPSRNLRKPKESAPRIAPTGREVQAPRGAIMLYRSPFEVGRPQYIRYVLPPRRD